MGSLDPARSEFAARVPESTEAITQQDLTQ
jgi:hypothetical protein